MVKTKQSNMTVTISRIVGLLVIAALPLVSLVQSQEAYAEGKKVSGTTKSITPLAQNSVSLPDKISFIEFRIELWVLRSSDPDWDNACVFSIRYDHPTKVRWFKGYSAITHPNGDQTFMKFDGKEESLGGGVAIYEAKGRYIGGTGRFKGITGSGTFKQKWTLAKTTTEWETEYEVR